MEELIERKARELVEGIPQEKPEIKLDLDTSKSYGEQAKEAIDFMATKKAIEDERLGDELTEKKKEELIHESYYGTSGNSGSWQKRI